LEAIKGEKTMAEIASIYRVYRTQIKSVEENYAGGDERELRGPQGQRIPRIGGYTAHDK